MKHKWRGLVIAISLLCVIIYSCSQTTDAHHLRICFDIGSSNDDILGSSRQEEAVSAFLADLEAYARAQDIPTLENVEVEVIPSSRNSSTERLAMLQRIRTEIMTGNGPDIFILRSEGREVDQLASNRLFAYPEKAIDGDTFLPLDDLLSESRFTKWTDMYSTILDGGKNRYGQQVVLPMTFSIPLVVFHGEDVTESTDIDVTWSEAITSDDPILSELSRWLWPSGMPLGSRNSNGMHLSGIAFLYPKLADFQSCQLSFTEDQLFHQVKEGTAIYRNLIKEGDGLENFTALPNYFNFSKFTAGSPFSASHTNTDIRMIPLPTISGGTVAEVSTYCAINRNTSLVHEAFFVLDLLMSENYQANSQLFNCVSAWDGNMPLNKNLCAPGKTYHKSSMGPLEFTQQQYDEWQDICGQVISVHFPSPLDRELDNMISEIQQVMAESYESEVDKYPGERLRDFIYGEITDEQLREIIHRHYKRMCRLIDES